MWWWKANSHIAPHILYKGVLLMSTAVLFLYVKAGKAGRGGSKTTWEPGRPHFKALPPLQEQTLCIRACGQYPCNGYWIKSEKGLWSYYFLPPGGIWVVGPQKSMLECHPYMLAQIVWLQITPLPFRLGSAESNRATASKGSTGNLCMGLLCFFTQILKRGFPGLAQMVT